MPRTFFPKAHYMPLDGGYRALFRWYEESPWTMVPKCAPLPTVTAALNAAEAYMRSHLNPPLQAMEAPPDADVLGIGEWRVQREQEAMAERERVFGSTTLHLRGGRTVAVETRRKRARA